MRRQCAFNLYLIMPDPVTLFAVTTASAALKGAVSDAYKFLKLTVPESVVKWKAAKGVRHLLRQTVEIRKVKTLWQVDKAVDLSAFYCQQHILINHKDRVLISDLSNVKTDDNLLIQGIAGQGKSMLLRYLCAREMQKGKRLPVFIELRKVTSELSLLSHIIKWFDVLGFELSAKSIKELGGGR